MPPRSAVIAGLLLAGCTFLSEAELDARLDLDGDGVPRPADCDDDDPDIGADGGFFSDADDDGYGGSPTDACSWQEGLVAAGGDCDDSDASIHPGAPEDCNGQDDDCDGEIDEGAELSTWYHDADGDGHGIADDTVQACTAPSGYAATDDDCDDWDPLVNPSQQELCDPEDVDEDCDGLADDLDEDPQDRVTVYRDSDGDGFGLDDTTSMACDESEGWSFVDGDCDDDDPERHPDMEWFRDADGDGYGASDVAAVRSCEDLAGYALDATDCDDGDAASNPGALEICDPFDTDEDCDGLSDDDDPSATGQTIFYPDSDGDGFGDPSKATQACDASSGWVDWGADCDESDAGVNPGVLELCDDGADQDCDGDIDCDDISCSRDDACGYWDLGGADAEITRLQSPVLAGAGDVNADGYDDLLLGTCQSGMAGGAYIVHGPVTGQHTVSSVAAAFLEKTASDDYGGCSVAGLGDVNSDGFDDVLVGAYLAGDSGAAFLFHGPMSGTEPFTSADAQIYHSNVGYALFGFRVSGGGDLDGDGTGDLLVSAQYTDALYLFSGTASGSLSESDAAVELAGSSNQPAVSLCMGGDLNGDGQGDLAIAESVYDGGVYLGYGPLSASGPLGSHLGAYVFGFPGLGYGRVNVAADDDINGDGYDDLLIGSYYGYHDGDSTGVSYLFYGPITGTHQGHNADAFLIGEAEDDQAGYATDLPGDLNLDGFGDILVGAPQRSVAQSIDGAAYVVFGPASGTIHLSDADIKLVGPDAEDEAGDELAGVGDVDGDGRPDILVSTAQDLGNQWSTYLLLGSGF